MFFRGKIMRLAMALVLGTALLAAAGAQATGSASLRYAVAVGGFCSTVSGCAEYFDISLAIDARKGVPLYPSFIFRYEQPFNPFSFNGASIGFGLELPLLRVRNDFLPRLFDGPSDYMPSLEATLYAPFESRHGPTCVLSFSPFRFYRSYGVFSALSPGVVYDSAMRSCGWHFEIIRFGYYLR